MLNEEAIEEFVEKNDLSYYNYEMHFSAMSMPNELKKDLKKLLK